MSERDRLDGVPCACERGVWGQCGWHCDNFDAVASGENDPGYQKRRAERLSPDPVSEFPNKE